MRTLSTRSIAVLGAGLVVVVVALLVTPKPAPEISHDVMVSAASGTDMNELQRVQGELDQNRRDTDALRKLVASLTSARASSPPTAAPEPQSAENVPPPSPERELAHIQAEFAAEGNDPSWNPGRELQAKVEEVMPRGSVLRSIECRRSMCRMETSHADLDDYNKFAHEFLLARLDHPLWTGPTTFDVRSPTRAGEALVVVGYLGRDSLPSLEPSRAEQSDQARSTN